MKLSATPIRPIESEMRVAHEQVQRAPGAGVLGVDAPHRFGIPRACQRIDERTHVQHPVGVHEVDALRWRADEGGMAPARPGTKGP